MKKKFLFFSSPITCFIFFISIAAIIGGIYYFYLFRENSFTLYKESGEVFYKSQEEDEYIKVSTGEIKLSYGSFIKTESAYTHIIFSDYSMMTLDKNTEVQILADGKDTKIKQLFGNSWHRIKRVVFGEEYTVETSTTIATVRGTKFSVLLNKNQVGILSTGGTVGIGFTKEGSYSDLQPLEAGNYAYISEGDNAFTIIPCPQDIKNSEWYKKNLLLDEKFEQENPEEFIKSITSDEKIHTDNPEQPSASDNTSQTTPPVDIPPNNEQEDENNQEETEGTQKPQEEQKQTPKDEPVEVTINFSEFSTSLIEKYHIAIIRKEQCLNINTEEFKNDIATYMSFEEQFTSQDQSFGSYLLHLEASCEDSEIDSYEFAELEKLYQAATAVTVQ